MSEDRVTTPEDIALAKDRLRGTGAWNGQGLLTHLALTSRKDPERVWMEPLRDLCQRVVNADEDGEICILSGADIENLDALSVYSQAFHAALDEARAATGE